MLFASLTLIDETVVVDVVLLLILLVGDVGVLFLVLLILDPRLVGEEVDVVITGGLLVVDEDMLDSVVESASSLASSSLSGSSYESSNSLESDDDPMPANWIGVIRVGSMFDTLGLEM